MNEKIDLTGQRFGKLTVVGIDGNNHKSGTYWMCICDCQNNERVPKQRSIRQDKLLEGKQYIKKSFKGKYTVITRKNTYKEIEAFIVDIIQNNKYLNKEFEILVESMFTIFKKEEGSIHFVKIYIPKF